MICNLDSTFFYRIAVLAVIGSCVSGCNGGEGADRRGHDQQLYAAILRDIHVEHPHPCPANPKPLSEQPRQVFTDRTVLKLADAIRREDLKEIDRLLDAGVNVNARGKLGCTPLAWARVCGSPRSFSHLLKKGADPGTGIWDVPLIYLISNTVQSEAYVYVKMLLKHGADPNATYPPGGNMHKGETALFPAAMTGNIEIVRLLVKAKADVNHHSDRGITALCDAAQNKRYQVVHVLLEAGAELGESPERGLLLDLAQDLAKNDASLKDPWRTKVVAWVEEHGYDLQPAIIEAKRREASRRQKIEERKRLWGDQDK